MHIAAITSHMATSSTIHSKKACSAAALTIPLRRKQFCRGMDFRPSRRGMPQGSPAHLARAKDQGFLERCAAGVAKDASRLQPLAKS
mmetsp:Transcript_43325/g.119849  ORF Transcript_43325/g.119849 Transcript_43325/m.119849 type:complete len:87 (+) Transcript_43325:39-299(+)